MKNTFWISLGLVVVSLFSFQIASASSGASGFTFNLGLYYTKFDTETKDKVAGSSKTSTDRTTYDLNLGYVLDNSIYLGVLNSTTSGSGGVSSSYQGVGTGYHFNQMAFIHILYLMNASYGSTYSKGTGQQVDFGFEVPVSGNVHVGTVLSHRSITYKEYTNGSTGNLISFTTTETIPMFLIGFNF